MDAWQDALVRADGRVGRYRATIIARGRPGGADPFATLATPGANRYSPGDAGGHSPRVHFFFQGIPRQ